MEPAAASGEESDTSGEGELGPPGGLLHHPKYAEMMALDIGQSTQVYAAFLVFLDLLEARNWKDVTYKGSKELQLIYLQGCPGEQENKKVVVPLPVHMSLSHERIRRIMDCICNENEQEITLAAVDSDSTVVYYQLTNGFVIPDPPDVIEDSKRCKKKRKKFQR
ncbi:tRNA-splicing endonuclease subunit Sen15 isoform X1 [Hypanus sabinus]|uniref:tRNA-splicing endonuclease subunit Sen15 isoform X1 n=1 Tax=Hypanus sabinus TaxID=79690 RepID=UPI0028C3BFA7|nr:tRNA-splicing endonuclease subunit Sen15 isoform X1 [Hypanus sabinus]